MKRIAFLVLLVVMLATAGFAVEKKGITTQSVSNTGLLRSLLQNRFDLVETDIEGIQSLQNKGRGTYYYVYSGTGSDSYTGEDIDHPKATLDAAVGLCTADAGDVIFVLQGHSETMGAAADEVDIDVAGITVIGCGEGKLRPLFNYTGDVTGAFAIGADDVTLYNLQFCAAAADVNDAIEIEAGAEQATIANCHFYASTEGTHEFFYSVWVGDASDRPSVVGCEIDMAGGAAKNAIFLDHDADYAYIVGNRIVGDYSDACIFDDTAACNHITIANNILFNGTVGGTAGLNTEPCIELYASTSGVIVNNTLICNVANLEAAAVGDDMYLAGNVYNEVEGQNANADRTPRVCQYTTEAMTAANGYDAADDPNIFTVTGTILCRAVAYATTQVTSTSSDTLTLGVTGDTACLLGSDVVDGTAFDENFVWTIDQVPASTSADLDTVWVVVPGGLDIHLYIDDHTLTAGVMEFFLEWIPLSSDAKVVAAAAASTQ